jgi:hypothetical protein
MTIIIGTWFFRVSRTTLKSRWFIGRFGGAGGDGTALYSFGLCFAVGRKILSRLTEHEVGIITEKVGRLL